MSVCTSAHLLKKQEVVFPNFSVEAHDYLSDCRKAPKQHTLGVLGRGGVSQEAMVLAQFGVAEHKPVHAHDEVRELSPGGKGFQVCAANES